MAARLIKFQATLTSVDASNLERAQRILKMQPERFTIIPNGVPGTNQRACPVLRGAPVFTVGHVGSLTEHKGWSIMAESVQALRATGRNVRYVIAGSGPDRIAVEALAQAHPESISYRGHAQQPRETVMPELDVLGLMSVQEGLPMSLIEALSVGLPVVATGVGGIPEAIRDGDNGRILPRDAVALTQAIGDLYDNKQKLAAMSASALKTFEERFEIGHIVRAYHSLYQSSHVGADFRRSNSSSLIR